MTYVAIVSGLGESASSYANGLTALMHLLRGMAGFAADRFAWSDRGRVINSLMLYHDADAVLVGHSFGGSVCLDVAEAIAPRSCRLFLIDPVPTSAGKRWTPGFAFTPPPNVTTTTCYRRTWFLPYPRAKDVRMTSRSVNVPIAGTDHNSVVMPACRMIFEALRLS